MYNYDFETPNLELAEKVYKVADKCAANSKSGNDDNSGKIADSITIFFPKINVTEMFLEIVKDQVLKKNPLISEKEIEGILSKYLKEFEENDRKDKEENQRLEEAILLKINSDAQAGWNLAYQLCEKYDNYEAANLRYELESHISGLTTKVRIGICKEYINYIEKDELQLSAANNAYKRLVILITSFFSEDSKNICKNELNNYLNQYYSLENNKIEAARFIMKLCGENNLSEEEKWWRKVYFNLSLIEKNDAAGYFIQDELLETNDMDLIKEIISKMNPEIVSHSLISGLISRGEYDFTDKILRKMELREKQNDDPLAILSDRLAWIESMLYNLKYERIGISPGLWFRIDFYDLTSPSHKNINKNTLMKVAKLKSEYSIIVSDYRKYLTDIYVYKYHKVRQDLLHEYLLASEKVVTIIPKVLDLIEKFKSLYKEEKITVEDLNNAACLKLNKFDLARCNVLKDLAVYYENNRQYDDAIRICNRAIEYGYLNDGTKMGMEGRKAKLLRKTEKSNMEIPDQTPLRKINENMNSWYDFWKTQIKFE